MKEPNRERKNPIKAINKIQLDEGQKEAKAGVYDKDVSIFLGNFGSGKAQPYYSKILTPSSWTTMGDIKVGDIVCTPSTPAKVLQIFEQGYKDIYRVYFDDGNFADCCEDHLWKVSTSDSRSHWKYKGSGQNKKALFKYPVKYQVLPLKIIKEDLIKNGHNHYNYAIPVSPVELEEKNYYIDPYILGCLLGDGSTRSTLSITTMDDFIYREFVCKLTPLGFILKKTTNSTGSLAETYRIVDTKGYTKKTSSATGINKINTIKEELRRLNLDDKLSYDKHIPIEYLQGSIKQRIALLQGLMDTDGSINKNSLTFSSSSLSLFKDIKYLIESLGGVVKIGKPKYFKNSSYKTHYRMTFKIGDINPFRLPRKKDLVKPNQYSQQRFITKVEYLHKEKAKCILIDNADHLYYTDNFIITHNTLTAVVTALDLLLKKQIDKIFITRPIDFEATGFLKGPQPLTAKVMTPFGWRTIGDLQVGELVTTPDGLSSKIISKSELNREGVYKITTTDGRVMECSRFHLFHTLTFNDKKHRTDKIKYNKTYEGSVKSLDEIINTFLNNNGKLNHYLPYCKPITFQETTDKYIRPYVLGVLLGDGCLSNSISFSNIDNELIDRMKLECKKMGLNVNNIKNTISYNISSNNVNNKPGKEIIIFSTLDGKEFRYKNVNTFLKSDDFNIHRSTIGSRCTNNVFVDGLQFSFGEKEGISTNPIKNELLRLNLQGKGALHKFIPKEYIYNASIEDRVELLRGLMDTDGTNDGKCGAFTTISKQLALDVIELVRSLGGRANFYTRNRIDNVTERPSSGNILSKHISYEVVISLDFNPFYITRKAIKYKPSYKHLIGIKSIELVREDIVQCIKIEDEKGLYITDDYIVTHNTASEKMAFHIYPIKQNMYDSYDKQKIDLLFEDGSIQIVPIDYMKGYTFTNSCTIVDEFEDISFEEFKLILTRLGVGSKLIFTGSEEQIGIKNSCIPKIKKLAQCKSVNFHILKGQHRNENIQKILDFLDDIPQKESDVL